MNPHNLAPATSHASNVGRVDPPTPIPTVVSAVEAAGYLDAPCSECGAESGERCAADCGDAEEHPW